MDAAEIRADIRRFLLGFVRGHDFTDADNIFAGGLVNSLLAMQLLLYVEKTFSISVQNDELDLANFSSIDALTAFIARKHATATVHA